MERAEPTEPPESTAPAQPTEPTAEGARSFAASGDAYDHFMGRYSRQLAAAFADAGRVTPGLEAVDVGCGPGALTAELVERLGSSSVVAIDPSPSFVAACAARFPDVEVRHGRAEDLPFPDQRFDRVLAQLVLHFVSDPQRAAHEMRRVLRPGGVAAACVWDVDGGMEMLRTFWDAALAIDPNAPDEARALRFGAAGEIAGLLEATGFEEVDETTLHVRCTYRDFDEFWSGFLAGIGPAGSFCVGLADAPRTALCDELFHRLGSPSGELTLGATARCAAGTVPVRGPG